jgi:hypothetical protein
MISVSYLDAGIFAVATSLIIFSGILMLVMIGRINLKLPKESRISEFGDYPGKQFRILREYRRLYPSSRLAFAFIVCTALGLISGFVAFISFVLH